MLTARENTHYYSPYISDLTFVIYLQLIYLLVYTDIIYFLVSTKKKLLYQFWQHHPVVPVNHWEFSPHKHNIQTLNVCVLLLLLLLLFLHNLFRPFLRLSSGKR